MKKILVIKLRHLGDVLLTTPLFGSLRQAFPHATIDAYIYQESIPMLEGHPAIRHFLTRNPKKKGWRRWQEELELFYSIRKEGYDLVLNLTEGDRGVIAAWASKAPLRVGFAPKGRWQKARLTHIVKSPHSLRHTVERNLDALRRIGINPQEKSLFFAIAQEDKKRVQELVGKGPFVLIHPASRWRFKCWPVEKMRHLAKKLIERGERVVLTAGVDPAEKEMVEKIGQGLDLLQLAGFLSLKELGAVIAASKLLVTVDSLPLHLASALKKPVVVLFGPTSEITWGPWENLHARVVATSFPCRPCYLDGCGGSKRSECLLSLPFSAVWEKVEPFL
ncbi:MAG: putative lipopolysaccharide heptosyltransferase III [Verrucomicrobiota bacterium]|nr:putative lipopolysaccharide heptosyltransferase III [Verrucomicrobiota bacterium]